MNEPTQSLEMGVAVMTQYAWQYVLEKFRSKGGVLSTYDFISDIHTAAEYRRIICDLKKKGYHVESFKATPKHWIYRLIEVQPDLLKVEAA